MLQSSSDSARQGRRSISYARILLSDVTQWESMLQSRITFARIEQKIEHVIIRAEKRQKQIAARMEDRLVTH